MALIKCEGCGHLVSDKAIRCPKCGTPVNKGEQTLPKKKEDKEFAEIKKSKGEFPTGAEAIPVEDIVSKPNKNGLKILFLLIVVIVIASLLYIVASMLFDVANNKSNDNIHNVESMDSILTEKTEDDRTEFVEADTVIASTTNNQNEIICDEYIRILYERKTEYGKNIGDEENASCYYFLYDITNDGVPELWIRSGYGDMGSDLFVYTYENGIKKLFKDSAWSTAYHKGNGYILKWWARQGSATWEKLTFNGHKIQAECIFDENTYGTGEDYTVPKEPEIEMYPYNNDQPIKNAFGVEP